MKLLESINITLEQSFRAEYLLSQTNLPAVNQFLMDTGVKMDHIHVLELIQARASSALFSFGINPESSLRAMERIVRNCKEAANDSGRV